MKESRRSILSGELRYVLIICIQSKAVPCSQKGSNGAYGSGGAIETWPERGREMEGSGFSPTLLSKKLLQLLALLKIGSASDG